MRRSAILFLLGVVVNSFPFFHFDVMRFYGVLQRIAICYLIAVALHLASSGWRSKLVVIVARLIADKRVDIALRALSLLPNLRVAVVGDGPERARLQDAFPTAEFTGNRPRSEALLYIAAADALVSASRHEGAPTVVREARALGVPVVAAPAGDLVEWARADAGIALI